MKPFTGLQAEWQNNNVNGVEINFMRGSRCVCYYVDLGDSARTHTPFSCLRRHLRLAASAPDPGASSSLLLLPTTSIRNVLSEKALRVECELEALARRRVHARAPPPPPTTPSSRSAGGRKP